MKIRARLPVVRAITWTLDALHAARGRAEKTTRTLSCGRVARANFNGRNAQVDARFRDPVGGNAEPCSSQGDACGRDACTREIDTRPFTNFTKSGASRMRTLLDRDSAIHASSADVGRGLAPNSPAGGGDITPAVEALGSAMTPVSAGEPQTWRDSSAWPGDTGAAALIHPERGFTGGVSPVAGFFSSWSALIVHGAHSAARHWERLGQRNPEASQ